MAYYEFGKPLPKEVMARIHRDVRKKFPVSKSDLFLDVGGGVGLFSRIFRARARRVILTDIALNMLKAGRRMDKSRTCLACDAARLPFADNSFDRVLCYSVFHYFANVRQARKVLRELLRVTKPGGMVFVGDVLFTEKEIPKAVREKMVSTSSGGRLFWPKELNHNLRKARFSTRVFKEFAAARGASCRILRQAIAGKATSVSRYDALIKKAE